MRTSPADPVTTLSLPDAASTSPTVTETMIAPRLTPEEAARQERLERAMVSDDFREEVLTSPTIYRDLEVTVSLVRFPAGREPLDPNEFRFVSTTETLAGPVGEQPRGAMTGKIVYCSAGHGWTNDNTSTSLWYTQRPALLGIVEDFGNLDQMNLYADFCFRAGATIVPMRPLGHQRIERIVDNDSPHHVVYQGAWNDSQSTVAFRLWNEEVPYRFAVASLEESAVARFRPTMPKADYYPVYAWARAGADRVNQTYRVVHSGGATEVRVNHRLVGNGWVYLGEYFFNHGNSGYVEVTNLVNDPAEADGRHVVIADAIRIGNGMGEVNRGGGISGRPREEEASRYWVERQLARGVEPVFEAFDGTDQGTNVGTPPRFAAHMNRETEGTFFDRVFLSFHTNAVGGRGVMGLYCVEPEKRTDCQVEWAELVAREINGEMLSGRTALPIPWSVHPKPAFGHINFGEIRRDNINNEMVATIAEMAYHDNPLDAMLLKIPKVRIAMARASYGATLKYLQRYDPAPRELLFTPGAPVALSAGTDETSTVMITWAPSLDDGHTSAAVEAYRVYHSTDGYGFDGGVLVGGATSLRYDGLTTGTPHFFRVTAVNGGGESVASRTLGTFALHEPSKLLFISGYSSMSEDAVVTQTASANMGKATGPGGEFVRIIPRLINSGNQIAAGGLAAAAALRSFDSVTLESLEGGLVDLARYDGVVALFGRQGVRDGVLSDDLQSSLSAYIAGGGGLVISGAGVVGALDTAMRSLNPEHRRFALETLGVRHGGESTATMTVRSEPRSRLREVELLLKDPAQPEFLHRFNDVITPAAGAHTLLRYENEGRDVAGVLLEKSDTGGTVVSLGFPFEEILTRESRKSLMSSLLGIVGVPEEMGAPQSDSRSPTVQRARPATRPQLRRETRPGRRR